MKSRPAAEQQAAWEFVKFWVAPKAQAGWQSGTASYRFVIAENIAYGRPGATHAKIEAAGRAANAHAFISQLPEGYDMVVGERDRIVALQGGRIVEVGSHSDLLARDGRYARLYRPQLGAVSA